MSQELKATLNAFLPEFNAWAYDYGIANKNHKQSVNALSFSDCEKIEGWALVGTADITVTVIDQAEFINARVKALKDQQTAVQAEAQNKINELDHKIQELLCLEAPKEESYHEGVYGDGEYM